MLLIYRISIWTIIGGGEFQNMESYSNSNIYNHRIECSTSVTKVLPMCSNTFLSLLYQGALNVVMGNAPDIGDILLESRKVFLQSLSLFMGCSEFVWKMYLPPFFIIIFISLIG